MEKWKILDKKPLLQSHLFTFYQYHLFHTQKKSEHNFYVLDTNNWVNIIAFTPQKQIILIKQYRAGIDQITIEIPGGIIDNSDKDILAAAKRELEEETGFIAKNYELIGYVHPNPSFITNKCYFVVAYDAQPVGKTDFDPSEYIETFTASPQQVFDLIREQKITHSLTVSAFTMLWLNKPHLLQ